MRKLILTGTLIVAALMLLPVIQGGKPAKESTGKSSVITGDIVSGPSTGSWSSGCIWSVDGHEGPTGSTVGGKMTISPVPTDLNVVGASDGTLTWNTHGEVIVALDSNSDWVKIPRLSQGTYYCPDSNDNTIVKINLRFYMPYVPTEGKWIDYSLLLNMKEFSSGQQVKIEVGKSTVTISGTNLPFDLVDFNSSSVDEAWMIEDDLSFTFKMVIDK